MFKNLFRSKIKKAEVNRVEVPRIEVDRAEVERLENDISNEYKGLTTKFRDTITGEIIEVAFDDHETFDKCMSNKNMQIVFS